MLTNDDVTGMLINPIYAVSMAANSSSCGR
jgi:hypothetical protein